MWNYRIKNQKWVIGIVSSVVMQNVFEVVTDSGVWKRQADQTIKVVSPLKEVVGSPVANNTGVLVSKEIEPDNSERIERPKRERTLPNRYELIDFRKWNLIT